MAYELQQNSATRPLLFLMLDSTDHISPKQGLTPTVTIRKPGGNWISPSGAVTEVQGAGAGNGWYQVAANATDTNTLGPLLLHATATGADPADEEFQVTAYNPDALIDSNVKAISDDTDAADNLEADYDGTGYNRNDFYLWRKLLGWDPEGMCLTAPGPTTEVMAAQAAAYNGFPYYHGSAHYLWTDGSYWYVTTTTPGTTGTDYWRSPSLTEICQTIYTGYGANQGIYCLVERESAHLRGITDTLIGLLAANAPAVDEAGRVYANDDQGNPISTVLAAIKAITDQIRPGRLTVVSPLNLDGTQMTLVRGDDHTAVTKRALEWTEPTAGQWPDLTNATLLMTVRRRSTGTQELQTTGTRTLLQDGRQSVTFEPRATDTALMSTGKWTHDFDVEATLPPIGQDAPQSLTLALGEATVRQDVTTH